MQIELLLNGFAILIFALQCLARCVLVPCRVQSHDFVFGGLFILAYFEKRLEAVAPEHIQADHIVLFFAKRQGDQAAVEVWFRSYGSGNSAQQGGFAVAARRDYEVVRRWSGWLKQPKLAQVVGQHATPRDEVCQKVFFLLRLRIEVGEVHVVVDMKTDWWA